MSIEKLIIADRDPTLVESLADHFRRCGVEVKTAYDAHTVLKLVHLDAPDAFVLGINMPCDNGISVCELLSAERRFAYLPTVLLTDHADDWLAHQCHDLQAYYAAKGPELARRVETLLEGLSVRQDPARGRPGAAQQLGVDETGHVRPRAVEFDQAAPLRGGRRLRSGPALEAGENGKNRQDRRGPPSGRCSPHAPSPPGG